MGDFPFQILLSEFSAFIGVIFALMFHFRGAILTKRRFISAISVKISRNRCISSATRHDIRQGGSLYIDALGGDPVAKLKIELVSQWQDYIEIESSVGFDAVVDEESQVMSIGRGEAGSFLRIITPEITNVFVRGGEIDLSLVNKFEGDISIECTGGRVQMDKVRGMNINLDCGEAALVSKKLIEGDKVDISCGKMKAKMVNGEAVKLVSNPGGIEVGAAYINRLDVTGTKDVKIDLLNGESRIESVEGNLAISNIDGAFKMIAQKGNVHLQVNKLVQGRGSEVSAMRGGIQMSMDPEIKASIDAQCLGAGGRAIVSIVSDSFEESQELRGAAGEGGVRAPRSRNKHKQGLFTGQSAAAKRPTFSTPGSDRSGKIDLGGAEAQALQQTVTKEGKREEMPLQGCQHEQEGEVDEGFDLTLISHGHIRVETLSWIEIIRRKHGFGDKNNTQGLPPAGVGRTASAKERVSEWMGRDKEI